MNVFDYAVDKALDQIKPLQEKINKGESEQETIERNIAILQMPRKREELRRKFYNIKKTRYQAL